MSNRRNGPFSRATLIVSGNEGWGWGACGRVSFLLGKKCLRQMCVYCSLLDKDFFPSDVYNSLSLLDKNSVYVSCLFIIVFSTRTASVRCL